MESIELNNGSRFSGHVLESNGVLFIYLNGGVLSDYFSVFNMPSNVEKIIEEKNGAVNVYVGYTHMYYMSEERANRISIGLKKA